MAGARGYSNALLGFVDELIEEKYSSVCDYTTNKFGGLPDWMPGKIPSGKELSCCLCGSYMSFICQIYAPLENSSLHRTLYTFACLRKTCWNISGSWKCFRSETKDETSVRTRSEETPFQGFQTTDWVEGADDWGSEEDENGNNEPPTYDLMNTLSINDNFTPDVEEEEEDEEEDDDEEEVSTTSTSDISASNDNNANDLSHNKRRGVVCGAIGELRATAVIEEDNEGETDVVIIDSPDQDFRENAATTIPALFFPTDNVNPGVISESVVFTPYFITVEEEIDYSSEIVTEHERRLVLNFHKGSDDSEERIAKNGACSGGEVDGYEKTVPRHGDVQFHKFLTIINKNPGQILRYSRDSNKGPLLLSKLSSQYKLPDRCSFCGGPVVFEFQLLSSLVSFLKTKNPGDGELEFGTVIIFTCEKSCQSSTDSIKLENILVQAEPM